jgi:transcription-repair coupling factor (superfamily II helicase)
MEGLPPSVDLPLAAALPEEYVPDRDLRLRLYRRMAEIGSEQDLDSLRRELEDRFGSLPDAAENLLYQLRVKILAQMAGVDPVAMEGGTIILGIALGEEAGAAEIHSRARYSKKRLYIPVAAEQDEWKPELIGILLRLVKRNERKEVIPHAEPLG